MKITSYSNNPHKTETFIAKSLLFISSINNFRRCEFIIFIKDFKNKL